MTVQTKTQVIGRDGAPDPESTTHLTVVKRDNLEFVVADNEPIQARAEVAILPEGTYIKVSDVVSLTERTIGTLQRYVGEHTDCWRQCSLVPLQKGIWPAFMPVEQAMAVVKDLAYGTNATLAVQFLRAIKRTADAAAEGKFDGAWAYILPAAKRKQYGKLLRKKQEEETSAPELEEETPEPEPEEPPTIEGSELLYLRLGQRIAEMQKAKADVEEICRELGIAPPWAQ